MIAGLDLLAGCGASVAACMVAVIACFAGIDLAVTAGIFFMGWIIRTRGIVRVCACLCAQLAKIRAFITAFDLAFSVATVAGIAVHIVTLFTGVLFAIAAGFSALVLADNRLLFSATGETKTCENGKYRFVFHIGHSLENEISTSCIRHEEMRPRG